MWTRPTGRIRTVRAPPRAVWGAARSSASDVMPGHRRAIFLARGGLHLSSRALHGAGKCDANGFTYVAQVYMPPANAR